MWGKLYGQMIAGANIFVYDHEKFTPADILQKIHDYRITSLCAPPTIYRFLIREDLSKYDLSSLEYCTTAGEALNYSVYETFKKITGIRLMEGFGQTETALTLATFPWMEPKPGSMGVPNPQYDITGCRTRFAVRSSKATIVLAAAYRDRADAALVRSCQDHVKRITAPYKYPRVIEFVDELPKTISGKIRRKGDPQRRCRQEVRKLTLGGLRDGAESGAGRFAGSVCRDGLPGWLAGRFAGTACKDGLLGPGCSDYESAALTNWSYGPRAVPPPCGFVTAKIKTIRIPQTAKSSKNEKFARDPCFLRINSYLCPRQSINQKHKHK